MAWTYVEDPYNFDPHLSPERGTACDRIADLRDLLLSELEAIHQLKAIGKYFSTEPFITVGRELVEESEPYRTVLEKLISVIDQDSTST